MKDTADRKVEQGMQDIFSQFDGLSPENLVRKLDEWQMRKDECELALKEINRIYDFLRITKIPAAFQEAGIENMSVAGVGRCSITSDAWCGIKDRDSAYQWLRDNGREDLITETVNGSTLKAVLKQLFMREGQVPDCFKFDPFSRASITRKGA